MTTLLKAALRVLTAPTRPRPASRTTTTPATPSDQRAASDHDRMARDVARRPDIHWMMYR